MLTSLGRPSRATNLLLGSGVVLALAALSIGGCASGADTPALTTPPASFEAYAATTRQLIRERRAFQSAQQDAEVAWNAPFELRPSTPGRKGVLLFHGLGDSPWSFVDLARDFVAQGYVVRAALLPGHGTTPQDMIDVTLEDWQRTVREQVALMKRDHPEIVLGGFSTGANLALEYAINDPEIRGLVLFSPAFRSDQRFDWITPWLAPIRTWLLPPTPGGAQSPVRYNTVPTNGFAQFYRSSVAVRELIERRDFDRPTAVVLAQHDSVVDVQYVRKLFERRFTHPASRLVWYGQADAATGAARILTRPDKLPEERISQFSHMGILFWPGNPLYGRAGSLRICNNGQSNQDTLRCAAGEAAWYSDWGYVEAGKVHARLTFNPYFDWQAQVVRGVLQVASEPDSRPN